MKKFLTSTLLIFLVSSIHAEVPTRYAPSDNLSAWNDYKYLPEEKNGATRLRIGLSSVSNFQPYPTLTPASTGEITCDLDYLFFAKSNTIPSDKEIERCALKEERANAKVTGVTRDTNNAFVRKDVIKEWAPKIINRIDYLKTKSKFYFRPNNVKLESFNNQLNGFPLTIGIGTWAATNYITGEEDYSFIGLNINLIRNTYSTVLQLPESVSRKVENAANKFAHVDYGLSEFHFKLDGVDFMPRPGKTTKVRVFFVSGVGWSIPFTDPLNPSIKTTLSSGIE